ncbi:elongin-C-like [Trachypithecus francoisi]|uniref:elongin-C-like n=1 Tax=Trachypithecus francoisi TaxID=54180 RepID=UPI00141B4AD9|nr:elongin-C-like [Trachypithecus francoisi]
MDKQNMVYLYSRILFSIKKEETALEPMGAGSQLRGRPWNGVVVVHGDLAMVAVGLVKNFSRSLGSKGGFHKNKMDGGEKTYGGCEGPDAMYVKSISSDGHERTVKREHISTPGTIKSVLSGPDQFAENKTNEVNFREIRSHVLLKVCLYFANKFHYTTSSTKIPEFPIAPIIALELLLAATFLDC